MATISVSPFLLKDVLCKIGADNFEAAVSQVEFNPNSTTVRWRGMTPTSSFAAQTTADWTVTVALAQDWGTSGSLSTYLFDNEGKTVVMDFYPVKGGDGFRASVMITPGSIGGTGDAVAVSSVTLGCTGKPQRITAAGALK